jgi:hypothetical protein
MKYKTVYAAHEARMWLQTILSGVAVGGAILAAHSEVKEKLKAVPSKIKSKFKKEEPVIKVVVVNTENKD